MKKNALPILLFFVIAMAGMLIGLFLGRNLPDERKILVPKLDVQDSQAPSVPLVINGKVNINTAESWLLQELPGIGEVTAQRIIEYREQHGQFISIDELMNIEGFGQQKLDDIRQYITTGG